jgi:hypothetical protein
MCRPGHLIGPLESERQGLLPRRLSEALYLAVGHDIGVIVDL